MYWIPSKRMRTAMHHGFCQLFRRDPIASKGKPGKFGSPQAGTARKGYRLDPGHPDKPPGDPEAGPHYNWWNYEDHGKGHGPPHDGAIPIE